MTKKSLLGAHGEQMRQPRRARAAVRFASALLTKSKGRAMPCLELFFLSCCFSASAIDVPWPVITSTWRSFAQKSHNLHLDHFAVAALALISG